MGAGASIAAVFDLFTAEATLPARAILAFVFAGIGLTLILSPWDGGVAHWVKNAAIRVTGGAAILSSASVLATLLLGSGAPATAAAAGTVVLNNSALLASAVALFGVG